MGEVYRARDTRLDRDVAVKVLPPHLSASEEGRQRFEREARTISQLSHPHICALYDVGRHGDTDYLVMELLEGETLAERLVKGALPAEAVLRFGIEIADALEKAHRQGIVHRDLKPGNVMLTRSGVKLLDFGLAKTYERSLAATGREQAAAGQDPMAPTSLTAAPTLMGSPNLTQEGSILGTFQYMAPEQLEGKDADARTDIFAFGAVLYEMATGRKAFSGGSQASLISNIMKEEPAAISTVQPMTPPALDRVVRTCLAKDPEDRFQTAHDAKLQLQWVAEGGSQAGAPAVVTARRKSRERLAWIVAGVALAAAGLATLGYLRRAPSPLLPLRAAILPPEKTNFDFSGQHTGSLSISPDGRLVTFVAGPEGGEAQLWVRPLGEKAARPIPGTTGAAWPFWSPDGRFIAFFADQKLKKVDVAGAPPIILCDAFNGRSGSWNRDGVIIFSPDTTVAVHRVSSGGGKPEPVTTLDGSIGETTHRWATFLPDGRHFLYMAGTHSAGTKSESNAIYVAALDSKDRTLLLRARSNVLYASGHLLYVLDKTLLAHPFDPEARKLTGDPVSLEESLLYDAGYFRAAFAASENGVLVYASGSRETKAPLVWYDRAGKPMGGPVAEPAEYEDISLSPVDRRLAATINDPATALPDIWLLDLSRGTRMRFTFGPGPNVAPVWSRDGSRLAYAGLEKGMIGTVVIKPVGGGQPETVYRGAGQFVPGTFSPDGRLLTLQVIRPNTKTGTDVWILPLFGERKPYPILESEFSEEGPSFSPDGRWISYVSDESGKGELYVTPFPSLQGKWQISNGGAFGGGWCSSGTELTYLATNQDVMSVAVRADGSTFDAAPPKLLFKSPRARTGTMAPSCERALLGPLEAGTQSGSLDLVSNWPALLKK